MKTYIAYVRVSTQRQSECGTSLSEQRIAIERYAQDRDLPISSWHEEVETAAKRGRPVFRRMVEDLKAGRAQGLLLHAVDRGARNLRDWAELGELIDAGVDLRFVREDLDLGSRGGRLVADIQAVVAADYIRNLRLEIRKGIVGRLRQGLYPLPAPFGYQDRGGGVVKVPDPFEAPLVIYAFERFAQGQVTQRGLLDELQLRGIGAEFSSSRLSVLLRNRFYAGTISVRGVSYPGAHQPLVSRELFDQVQRILLRRRPGRARVAARFRFQGRARCSCGRTLTGERQKSYVYYRCHGCPGVSVREEKLASCDEAIVIAGRHITIECVSLVPYGKFESCTLSAQTALLTNEDAESAA